VVDYDAEIEAQKRLERKKKEKQLDEGKDAGPELFEGLDLPTSSRKIEEPSTGNLALLP